MISELQPGQLRRSYNPESLNFQTTDDVQAATRIIGQPRGVRAIEFGLAMKSAGFNIYVLGESGTGRTTAIQHFVESKAAGDTPAPDWIYVHNFAEPDKPLAISFPPGDAQEFSDALKTLIHQLRGEILRAFDNQSFRDAVLQVQQNLDSEREGLFIALQEQAREKSAALISSPEGFKIAPIYEGKPMTAEQYAMLSQEQKDAWVATNHALQHDLNEAMHQARKLEINARQELEELQRRVAASVVDGAIAEIESEYADHAKVLLYLDMLHKDIIDNVDLFRVEEEDEEEEDGALQGIVESKIPERFRRYQVNILVDNDQQGSAPVIVELDPTLPRLLGRVEHEARRGGAIVTDFTLIRPGALHAANGGYLVIRARDVFTTPGAWEGLKRALVSEVVRPDDPATRGGTAVRTLDPEAIPLDIKVILVGPAMLYYTLVESDEDFQTIFKVMADFDEIVDRTPENELDYATFIATRVLEENLLPLDQSAVGRVIEYGARLAGTQDKLSTRFGQIADLVRESTYWAEQKGHKIVSEIDVEAAIDHREYLQNRIETRMRESLVEGRQIISTTGEAVGQINGLTVLQIGRHSFGHPSRLTARTYAGKEGVVQIDREAQLAGPIHNKGLLTLVGYLGGQYAGDIPLTLSAKLTFEQNYGGIDGDSASSAELYALLSSLSNIPIRQGIAVTGSVNQAGEIQAIGGVTQKVEGWFNVCRDEGLTGDQGVMIPASNVQDLMLRVAVVEAVEAGQFHLWAVSSVDEGLEVLTGHPAADVHALVKKRLEELAKTMKEFDDD
jgi:lon-related putative ATP-dependent protease